MLFLFFSPAMESQAVNLSNNVLSLAYLATPSVLHNASRNSAATYTPLSTQCHQLFIRRDNGERDTVVNVFDFNGTRKYTFERNSSRSTPWIMYNAASREQVAAINIGLFQKSIDFLTKPGLRRRVLNGRITNSFYLNDGAQYVWTRSNRFLERVINPGGGSEEIHERIAQVNLLRRFRFDWELLVERHFDVEVAAATAFVAMQTQWSLLTTGSARSAVHDVV